MESIIKKFPEIIIEGIKNGNKMSFPFKGRCCNQVVIAGQGASGTGGKLAKQWGAPHLRFSMEVIEGYLLPKYANRKTLLLVTSYSGNTEETCHILQQGLQREMPIVCISSSGRVKEIALNNELLYINLPFGLLPRLCTAYSAIQLLYILQAYQKLSLSLDSSFHNAASMLQQSQSKIQQKAKKVAAFLAHCSSVIIYTTSQYEAVAIHLKQQLNENSKRLCWYNIFPSVNHNELEGWSQKSKHIKIIFLQGTTCMDRESKQMELAKAIIQCYAPHIEVKAEGDSHIAQSLYMIHFADWLSYYLAVQKGVDPCQVERIELLKERLSNTSAVPSTLA